MNASHTLLPHGRIGNAALNAVYADIHRLPRWLRPLFHALTALPVIGRPAPRFDPLGAGLRDGAIFLGFAALAGGSAALVAQTGSLLPVLPAVYGALGVTGRLRRASVGHVHEATHGVVTKHLLAAGRSTQDAERTTRWVMDIASALSLTTNGEDYGRNHRKHHDEAMLGTVEDPDGLDLKGDGFWTGQFRSERHFYGRLAARLVDPLWHLRKLRKRLRSNLLTGKPYRRALGAAALAGLALPAFVLPFPVWLMAIGLPWTVLYNAASLLQVLTKHTYGHDEGTTGPEDYADRCHERIPYRLMPPRGGTIRQSAPAWAAWVAGILLVDLPARLAVLDSSMIGHGWHHVAWPAGRRFNDWTNTVHRMIEARLDGRSDPRYDTRVLLGLESPLARQASFMTKR